MLSSLAVQRLHLLLLKIPLKESRQCDVATRFLAGKDKTPRERLKFHARTLMKMPLCIWRRRSSCRILRDLGCMSLIPRMRTTNASLGSAST